MNIFIDLTDAIEITYLSKNCMCTYLYQISLMCPVLSFCNYFHPRAPFYKYRYIFQDKLL